MRSRANIKAHPIHPSLIPYPFALLTGAFVFDALGVIFDRPTFWTTGEHLEAAGILMAVIAAVPGAIDYFYTVPPQSSARQRATQHALMNLAAVILMTLAWFVRDNANQFLVLSVEFVAAALLCYGSYQGGTLVTRNQISIDHRYAEAGKWTEATFDATTRKSLAVAKADELRPNQMKLLRLRDRRVVLARTEDGYVAFEDRCTHRGGSLAGGTMICGTVQCPWHGSQFNTRTGKVKAGPAKEDIRTYPVAERDGEIWLAG